MAPALQTAAVNAVRLLQDPTFRVLLGAAGAFAGAMASDRWINESDSIAIMPMGAVLGAAVGALIPKLATHPALAVGMVIAAVLGAASSRQTLVGSPQDIREMSKLAGIGCAVALGALWP